jgi:hypothetical protein
MFSIKRLGWAGRRRKKRISVAHIVPVGFFNLWELCLTCLLILTLPTNFFPPPS